jgi:hypothetical protein
MMGDELNTTAPMIESKNVKRERNTLVELQRIELLQV